MKLVAADQQTVGVFVNGERIDMRELDDGDCLLVGRYQLHFIRLQQSYWADPAREFHTAVG